MGHKLIFDYWVNAKAMSIDKNARKDMGPPICLCANFLYVINLFFVRISHNICDTYIVQHSLQLS